jgi:hypothetical protein
MSNIVTDPNVKQNNIMKIDTVFDDKPVANVEVSSVANVDVIQDASPVANVDVSQDASPVDTQVNIDSMDYFYTHLDTIIDNNIITKYYGGNYKDLKSDAKERIKSNLVNELLQKYKFSSENDETDIKKIIRTAVHVVFNTNSISKDKLTEQIKKYIQQQKKVEKPSGKSPEGSRYLKTSSSKAPTTSSYMSVRNKPHNPPTGIQGPTKSVINAGVYGGKKRTKKTRKTRKTKKTRKTRKTRKSKKNETRCR